MKCFLKTLAVLTFAAIAATSCGEKINPEEEDRISEVELQRRKAVEASLKYLKDDIFGEYYYWYREMRDVPYTYQTDIYDFFDDLLVKQDRWSWMMDGQDYVADEAGIVYGTYGVSLDQPYVENDDYNVYVRYVYPGGPFDNAGVKRGWMIKKAGGIFLPLISESSATAFNRLFNEPPTNEPRDFTFIDTDGNTVERSITASVSLTTRPCLKKTIFTAEDYPGLTEPVGYYNYLSFKADDDSNGKSMLDDISEPMAYFKEHNVKTLIVDLRYNGGGDSRASDLLVSYLAPLSADGEVYVRRTHNDKLSKEDSEQTIECAEDSPLFESLYFITGRGSASASEMTLNGLKPLANVHHVGQVTYGKPNGMYVFYYPNDSRSRNEYSKGNFKNLKYVFLPICFYNANGEGTLIPDTGIVPDNERPDDLTHDFGAEEDNIAACLYHIVNGTYPDLPPKKSRSAVKDDQSGIILLLKPEEKDPYYGSYIVKPDFL